MPASEMELLQHVLDLSRGGSCLRKSAQDAVNSIPPGVRIPQLLALVHHGECGVEERALLAKRLARDIASYFAAFFRELSNEDQKKFLDDFFSCVDLWAKADGVLHELCWGFSSIVCKLLASSDGSHQQTERLAVLTAKLRAYLEHEDVHQRVVGWKILGLTPRLIGPRSKNFAKLIQLFNRDVQSSVPILRTAVAHCIVTLAMSFSDDPEALAPLKSFLPFLMTACEESIVRGETALLSRLSAAVELCHGYLATCVDELLSICLRHLENRNVSQAILELILDLMTRSWNLASAAEENEQIKEDRGIQTFTSLVNLVSLELKTGTNSANDRDTSCFDAKFVSKLESAALWMRSGCTDECELELWASFMSLRLPQGGCSDWYLCLATLIVGISGGIREFPGMIDILSRGVTHEDQRIQHASGNIFKRLCWRDSMTFTSDDNMVEADYEAILPLLMKNKDPYLRLLGLNGAAAVVYSAGFSRRLDTPLRNVVLRAFEDLVSNLPSELAEFYRTGSTSMLAELLGALNEGGWEVCMLSCQGCDHRSSLFPVLRAIARLFKGHEQVRRCYEFLPVVWKVCDRVLKDKDGIRNLSLLAVRCYLEGLGKIDDSDDAAVEDLRWVASVLKDLQPVEGHYGFSDSEIWIADNLIRLWTSALGRDRFLDCAKFPVDLLPVALASLIRIAAASPSVDEIVDGPEVRASLHMYRQWNPPSCHPSKFVYFYAGNKRLLRVDKGALGVKISAVKQLAAFASHWFHAAKPHLFDIVLLMGDVLAYNFDQESSVRLLQLNESTMELTPIELREEAAMCVTTVLADVARQKTDHFVGLWMTVESVFVSVLLDAGRVHSGLLMNYFRTILKRLPEEHVIRMLPSIRTIILACLRSYLSEFSYTESLDEKDDDAYEREFPRFLEGEIVTLVKAVMPFCKESEQQFVIEELPELCERLTAFDVDDISLQVGVGVAQALLTAGIPDVGSRLKWLFGRLVVLLKRCLTCDGEGGVLKPNPWLSTVESAVGCIEKLVACHADDQEVLDNAIDVLLRSLREQRRSRSEDRHSLMALIMLSVLQIVQNANCFSPKRNSQIVGSILAELPFKRQQRLNERVYVVLAELFWSHHPSVQPHKGRMREIAGKELDKGYRYIDERVRPGLELILGEF